MCIRNCIFNLIKIFHHFFYVLLASEKNSNLFDLFKHTIQIEFNTYRTNKPPEKPIMQVQILVYIEYLTNRSTTIGNQWYQFRISQFSCNSQQNQTTNIQFPFLNSILFLFVQQIDKEIESKITRQYHPQ